MFQSILAPLAVSSIGGGGWRNQGTHLDAVATQLLPESRKRRKHAEIVAPNTRFGTEGVEGSNPFAPTNKSQELAGFPSGIPAFRVYGR